MDKTTFSHYGAIIAVVIILAIMVAFATPFGDYVSNSSSQLISSFTSKSNGQLGVADSRSFKFRPLLTSRVLSAKNQLSESMTYEAEDVYNPTLTSSLIAFATSVDELNIEHAQLLDVEVDGEFTSATLEFDVSDLARDGEQVAVYHYNEGTSSWEHIGTYDVGEDRKVTATFASLSPVALVNISRDYTANEEPGNTPEEPQEPQEPAEITDLTGTTWVINDEPVLMGSNVDYVINFTSNSTSYMGMSSGGLTQGALRYVSFDGNSYTPTLVLLIESEPGLLNEPDLELPSTVNYTWENNAYKTITITGGTDATNADLIAWLQANATQEATGLIVFRINNMPFLAESGMTWAQWVAGEYNTGDFYIADNKIYTTGGLYVHYAQGYSSYYVVPSDTIIANYDYFADGGSND